MKQVLLKFGTGKSLPKINTRRFPGVSHQRMTAYKSDGKKTAEEIEAEKKSRKLAIEVAEKAYNEFEVKEPADLQKSFDLLKAVIEAKALDGDKNSEEKLEAVETAIKASETATAETVSKLKTDLEITVKALDQLQSRIKDDIRKFKGAHEVTDTKTFNEYLADAINENAAQIKAWKPGAPELKMEMKAVGVMNMAANFPGATPWVQNVSNNIIPNPYNRVWLSDLLMQGNSSAGSSIIYPKENGGEGGAALWTDRTADKAQMDFDLTTQSAFFKWIAGWVEVDREMLDDVPFLLSYLQSKMLISLKTAENAFILNGSADTNPVDGLLDVATAYSGTQDTGIGRIIDSAYGQIPEDTFDFYTGTTVVLRPRGAVEVGLNQASGSGEFDLPQGSASFGTGKLNLAGLQTATTTSIDAGKFLTFDRAATMFIRRMQPELRMFEDAVLAKKNRIMFRIEERATLAIFNNDAIVLGDLAGS